MNGPLADRTIREALAALPVPDHGDRFWSDVGARLLAEQEAPAAPPPDPVARLVHHRTADGTRPDPAPAAPLAPTVEDLARQADPLRPRPDRRRQLIGLAVALAVVAVAAAAIAIGVDGAEGPTGPSAVEVADRVSASTTDGAYLVGSVSVAGRTASGRTERYELTRSQDGSFRVRGTNVFTDTSYDARLGLARAVIETASGHAGEPTIDVYESTGLSTGPPDPEGFGPAVRRDEVDRAIRTLRLAGDREASTATVDGRAAWVVDASLPSAGAGDADRVRVVVDQERRLPVRVTRYAGDRVVEDVHLARLRPASAVAPDGFVLPLPPGREVTRADGGFRRVDIDQVGPLVGYPPATPGWLPAGFELATVAVRPGTGTLTGSTAQGANPPDRDVVSLTYRHGADELTLTTRADGGPATRWVDPFRTGEAFADVRVGRVDTGRFHGARTERFDGRDGEVPHVWGRGAGYVFTAAGDVTPAQLDRVVGSLR